jgi:hypothetical protein
MDEIILLLTIIALLLAIIVACLLYGGTSVLAFGLFLLVGFGGCVALALIVYCLGFVLKLSSTRRPAPSDPVLESTVDFTSRGASFTMSRLEAAGFRFSHRTGDLWHFVKDTEHSEPTA